MFHNDDPNVQHLLSTTVKERFGSTSFPVYAGNNKAKLGRIKMDWERIRLTLKTIRAEFPEPEKVKILELGANPYFLTQMIRTQLGAEIHTNGCPLGLRDDNDQEVRSGQVTFHTGEGEAERVIENHLFNVEEEPFPYEDSSFDLVICQELIEHLLFSPTFMLNQIHRVLKKEGKLIISCPNIARIDVLRKILANKNPIWGYVRVNGRSDGSAVDWPGAHGVYGRHNREYTLNEVTDLVKGCGFSVLESKCVTFKLPAVDFSLTRPMRLFQTLIYRSMKSATFLPIGFLRMKKDFVFVVAQKCSATPIEYYPPQLYDVWQVEKDETSHHI
jgi:SAM-dependent methyltransferase